MGKYKTKATHYVECYENVGKGQKRRYYDECIFIGYTSNRTAKIVILNGKRGGNDNIRYVDKFRLVEMYVSSERGQDVDLKNAALPIFDVSKSYCGEHGDDNIKADLREIYDACGNEQEFIRLYNEMKLEKDEQDFDNYMEDKVSNL